jgi:hypothetical protein
MSAREPASTEAPSMGYIIAKSRRAFPKAAMISISESKLFSSIDQNVLRCGKAGQEVSWAHHATYSKH